MNKQLKDMTLEEYQDYHNLMASNYPWLDNFAPNGPHWSRTMFFLKYIKPEHKVLDCGCSNGGLAKYLTENVGCTMFCFDIAMFFSQNAQKNAPKAICGCFPIEKTPFVNEVFDVIIAAEVLEHVLDIKIALQEILRVCKSGGFLLITTPDESENDGHTKNDMHLRFLGAKEWTELLPGCTIEYSNKGHWFVFYRKP